VEDKTDAIQAKDSPFSPVNTEAMGLDIPDIKDTLSKEILSVSSQGTRLFLKVEPRYRDNDKGIYTITVPLWKRYDWKIPSLTRFAFHLEGSGIRADPSSSSAGRAKDSWSEPIASQTVDVGRTPKMAAETLRLIRQ
jgi:hypothetical protein